MSAFLMQIRQFFQQPPGNMAYHLVILFILFFAFQSIWVIRRNSRFLYIKRLTIGLYILLAGQAILLLAAAITWLTGITGFPLLSTLNRAINAISLVWIIWLWVFPVPERRYDLIAIGVSGFLFVAWIVTFIFVSLLPVATEINGTSISLGWNIVLCVLALAGLILTFIYRPFNWNFGLALFFLLFLGSILQITLGGKTGNYPGIFRFSQLAAYLLLPLLALRLFSPPVTEQTMEQARMYRERRRFSAEPRTLQAWFNIPCNPPDGQLPPLLAKAIGQTMLADICYLILTPQQQDDLIFLCGYDLIREQELTGFSKSQKYLPSLTKAVQNANSLIYNVGSDPNAEWENLADAVELRQAANTMYVPLANADVTWGGILLLTPFSERLWTQEDQKYLSGINEYILQKLLQLPGTETVSADVLSLQSALQKKQDEFNELQAEFRQVLIALNEIQQAPEGNYPSLSVPIPTGEKITTQLDFDSEDFQQDLLENPPSTFRSLLASQAAEKSLEVQDADLTHELQLTLEEVAYLQNQLADSNVKILALENQISQPENLHTGEQELIANATQELRQPLASLVGYTDLLLSESVGNLDNLQKKFLERIKAAANRQQGLLEDLIRLVNLERGNYQLMPMKIDLMNVIDQAVTEISSQFLEKDITLRVDVASDIPTISLDQEAVTQILIQLLQNAVNVSQPDSAVTLKALVEQRDGNQYLLMQISDSGGGIPAEDYPRVFTHHFDSETPAVEGVSDTGMGLSIAKSLTEAHNGRIWVDSIAGEGSTFCILLPLDQPEIKLTESNDEPEA